MDNRNDYCVGIDLGTTNTVCAVWESGQRGPKIIDISQPADFTSGAVERLPLLPSVLSKQPEGYFVGKAARQALGLGRGKTFASTKRNMGKPWVSPTELEWTPERVAGAILQVVYRELGRRYGKPPLRVIITVPASFGTESRRATLLAARLAGFDPATVRLFDEPTAALLGELKETAEEAGPEPRRIMVIDIGGGTLDVSLVALHREGETEIFDVQGQSRLNALAGDDFDLNISGLLLKRFLDESDLYFRRLDHFTRIRLCADLLVQAEDAKRRLATVLRGEKPSRWGKFREPVLVTETPNREAWRTELTGNDLAAALLEYFPLDDDPGRRREEVTFFRPIQECRDAASKMTEGTSEPDEIWLAGGSAYLPFIPVATQQLIKKPCRLVRQPMHAVALGAAWFAGLEFFGDGAMRIRERMFEGIYLRTADGGFVEMVGARERVPMERIEHGDLLAMPMSDRRVEVDLFVGHDDSGDDPAEGEPKLMPLARRRVSFPKALDKGQRISVGAEVTPSREVLLDFFTSAEGQRLSGQVTASLAYGESAAGSERPLPPINQRSEDAGP